MLTVCPTEPSHAILLCHLQREAFLPLYERYHDSGNPCLRDEQDILLRLDHPAFRYFTLMLDEKIIGGALWRIAGRTPFMNPLPPREYYLQRIYIQPALQGRHLAQEAIHLCETYFPDAVRFHVDFPEDLIKNKRCYEGAGYQDTGRRLTAEPGLVLAAYTKEICPERGTT